MSETTGAPTGAPSSRWDAFGLAELNVLVAALRQRDHDPRANLMLREVTRARDDEAELRGRDLEMTFGIRPAGLPGGSGPACEVVEHHVDPRLAERLAERLGPPAGLDTAKAGPEGTGPCHLRPGDHTPVPGRRELLVLGDPVVVDGADQVRVVTHGGRSELIFRHVVRVEIHANPGEHGC